MASTNGTTTTSSGTTPPTSTHPPPAQLSTIDAILSHYSKSLKPGESISIPLYKGPGTVTSIDPIKKTRLSKSAQHHTKTEEVASSSSTNSGGGGRNPMAQHVEKFPKMAKFIETVKKPDFKQALRLYQEDIPKAKVRILNCHL